MIFVPKEKMCPHLWAHLSPFEFFNLVKKQRMHAHPKSQTFWLEIFASKHMDHFWANIWNPHAFDTGQELSLDQNGWMQKVNHFIYKIFHHASSKGEIKQCKIIVDLSIVIV
jgi:hypothetical protein